MGAPMSPEPERSNTRLSSMDLLPDEAIPALERATASLIGRCRAPISVVLEAFFVDLEELGIEPPARIAFRRWAQQIVDGDFAAVQLCQSNGELRPSSAGLLVRMMLVQADDLERCARHLRASARSIAAIIPRDGRPA